MSETITLGKSRKDGTWIVLVQLEKPFGEHLDAYRKIASKHPVSNDFTRVVIGKLHHSSPALVLMSTDEAAKKVVAAQERQKSVEDIVSSADQRQQEQQNEAKAVRQAEHDEAIVEKNAMIKQVRKDTGQPQSIPPAKREQKNKYLDEFKDCTKDELISILTESAKVLAEDPDRVDAKQVNEAATELLKKFNK